jgi:hypothetical protein
MLGGVGKQRHVSRSLHRLRHHPLMLRTGAYLAAGVHLASVGDVALQQLHVLVIDDIDVPAAELAATRTAEPAAPATTAPTAAAATATVIAAAAIITAVVAATAVIATVVTTVIAAAALLAVG